MPRIQSRTTDYAIHRATSRQWVGRASRAGRSPLRRACSSIAAQAHRRRAVGPWFWMLTQLRKRQNLFRAHMESGTCHHRRMTSWVTKTVVVAALIGVAGVTVPANAQPTGPEDPSCAATPELAECLGSPYDSISPTGPSDTQCISMPSDPVCAGGPYGIPSAPPPPPPPPPVIAPPPPPPPVIAPPPPVAPIAPPPMAPIAPPPMATA